LRGDALMQNDDPKEGPLMARTACIATLAILVVLTGCSTHPTHPALSVDSYHLTPSEQLLLDTRLHGATQPRLSVAMSGGGIRSALFNFGALKALYDDGVLSQADIVSSVSGGSYLNYWLYSEQRANPGTPFGYPLFGEPNFAHNLCKLTAESNFVPYQQMAIALAKRVKDPNALLGLYDDRFQKSFGSADPGARLTIADLKEVVEAGNPYPIFNASTYGSMPGNEVWERRVFEMTPLHYGNLVIRTPWNMPGAPARNWTLANTALASGAAISILKRRFDAPFPDTSTTYLWDGGKTENLGAVAPLVRGTKKLIIIDAQMDSNEHKYSAVTILRKRMNKLGTVIALPEGGEEAGPAVYPGLATTGTLESRLYYVKMKIPQSLRERIARELQRGDSTSTQPYADAVAKFVDVRGKSNGVQWECEGSRAVGLDVDKLMLASTAAYMSFAEDGKFYHEIWRVDPPGVGSLLTHQFPRTATPDQSFALDQALAYVGLGYLNAKGQVKALIEQPTSQ
jgi:hypothetical protein